MPDNCPYLYCLFSAMVLKKYGYSLSEPGSSVTDPSALYVTTTVLKCVETPAMGSTVSVQAGPRMPTVDLGGIWIVRSRINLN